MKELMSANQNTLTRLYVKVVCREDDALKAIRQEQFEVAVFLTGDEHEVFSIVFCRDETVAQVIKSDYEVRINSHASGLPTFRYGDGFTILLSNGKLKHLPPWVKNAHLVDHMRYRYDCLRKPLTFLEKVFPHVTWIGGNFNGDGKNHYAIVFSDDYREEFVSKRGATRIFLYAIRRKQLTLEACKILAKTIKQLDID